MMAIIFPIKGRRVHYSGSNESKIRKAEEFNILAIRVENYVNQEIRNGFRGIFSYRNIGIELGIDSNIISEILYCVDCGDTGFTIPRDIII
jgi:hypothetical protein